MTRRRKVDSAHREVIAEVDGATTVRVWRDYPAGNPPTVERVWQIVRDFGGAKAIFPLMLSVLVSYPDAADAVINTVRSMTFAPPDPAKPLSSNNALAFAVEKLVELDEEARCLTYISVLGMPVQNYRSVMQVTGDDQCRLIWISSFVIDPGQEAFVDTLLAILEGGANQIAVTLGLD
jgi:hypothetical protein